MNGLKGRVYEALRFRTFRRKLRNVSAYVNSQDVRVGEVPRGWQALVIAPHPDDESIGCGGTLKLIADRGGAVDVVFLTRGESGFRPGVPITAQAQRALEETRRAEAEQACGLLGVRETFFLQGSDGHLHHEPHLHGEVRRALLRRRYDVVLCPWPHDRHNDHQTGFRFLRRALVGHGAPIEVWLYEVWTPLMPTVAIDVSSVIAVKREAIASYHSQIHVIDYVSTALALARYRSTLIPGVEYVEAFLGGPREWVLRLL